MKNIAVKDGVIYLSIPKQKRKEALMQVPSGGTKGQVLMKNSDEDYDFSWQDVPALNQENTNGKN